MFNITGLKEMLRKENILLLADRGYSDIRLITPEDDWGDSANKQQATDRSICEIIIGLVKTWKITSDVARVSFAKHVMAVIIAYKLAHLYLEHDNPTWRLQ